MNLFSIHLVSNLCRPTLVSGLCISLCSLFVLGCGDETPSDDDGGAEDVVEDEGPQPDPGPAIEPLSYLEIADDPEAVSALACDDTSTPGADIDAGLLYSDPSLTQTAGSLSECVWAVQPGTCPTNIFADVSAAHGAPDGTPGGGFVALNGGTLRCKWSNGAALTLGNVVKVFELSAENQFEAHAIRACRDAEGTDCGPWKIPKNAGETLPAGSLFF